MQEILSRSGAVVSSSPGQTGGEGGTSCHDNKEEEWQEAADSLTSVEEDVRELYVAAMEESKFDSAELEEVHTLAEKAQTTLDPRSPMVRAVLRDMRQLQEANLVHPDSAIFVRQVCLTLYSYCFCV